MALRVINGGRKGQDGSDDSDEELGGRTKRNDATEVDVDDDDDDGLGSSTIVGVAPSPPVARTAGVGKFDFDDNAIDDALSSIEDKAIALPPGPQVPARHFPAPSTHGRAQSANDGTMPPSNRMRPYTGQMPQTGHRPSTGQIPQTGHRPSTGQMQHMPQVPHMGHMEHMGHPGHMTPIPGAMQPPMLHTPMPQAPKRSRAPLYAIIGVVLALAVGGIVAYAVIVKDGKKNNEASVAGSGSATDVTSGSAGSAISVGSAGSAVASAGSAGAAGSAVTSTGSATGSAGSADSGAAGSAAQPQPAMAKGDLASVEHPVVAPVTAQVKGKVATVAVPTLREVKSGESLFTIRSRSGANVEALAKRVRELEALAKDDPDSYQPFLKRARNELRGGQAPIVNTVKADTAGTFQSKVKVGDEVAPGTVLGNFVDSRTWIGIADISGATVTAAWICTVADSTHTAGCKIQVTETINGGSGTRVTAEISATGTSWLEGPSHPWLVLEPPASH